MVIDFDEMDSDVCDCMWCTVEVNDEYWIGGN